MVALIWFHQLHLQWKFKSWTEKFASGVKAKRCWVLSTNFENKKFVHITQQGFAVLPQVNFPANSLNFQWRWCDQIQAIFLNLFYFKLFTIVDSQVTYTINGLAKTYTEKGRQSDTWSNTGLSLLRSQIFSNFQNTGRCL